MQAVHTDSDRNRERCANRFALNENTGKLLPATDNVIRPLQRKLLAKRWRPLGERIVDCKRGNERQLRRIERHLYP